MLYNNNGDIYQTGIKFYGAGVNSLYPIWNGDDYEGFGTWATQSELQAIVDAGAKVIRCPVIGFLPKPMRYMKINNVATEYRGSPAFYDHWDTIVARSEAIGLGILPVFFWNITTLPDLHSHNIGSGWGSAGDEQTYMTNFVSEFVNRYKSSTSIWGWVFGNEVTRFIGTYNSFSGEFINTNYETPASRSASDDMTLTQWQSARDAFVAAVQTADTTFAYGSNKRLILTGNGYSKHLSVKGQIQPNLGAWLKGFDDIETQDGYTTHLYKSGYLWATDSRVSAFALLDALRKHSKSLGKVLVLDEWGIATDEIDRTNKFKVMENAIIQADVQLALYWEWTRTGADSLWNIRDDLIGRTHFSRIAAKIGSPRMVFSS